MMSDAFRIDGINIEVTNSCPLRCPQCYCSLEGGSHISIERVYEILNEASNIGVSHIEFSGGETLCYPYIYDAIEFASRLGLSTSISISGWGFDSNVLARLVKSGLDGLHVSLNASTKEKNDLSRDGYELSIRALEIISEFRYNAATINWVMHRNTADDLQNMVKLAEKYRVSSILVMDPKPDSKNELFTYPTKEQLINTAQIIRNNVSSVDIEVHHCFSVLAALVGDNKLWGNLNRGLYRGCTAGLCSLSVSVDGSFIPCRHLELHEEFDSIAEYWHSSHVLNKIRDIGEVLRSPCDKCRLSRYCRHCLAVNKKLHNEIFFGNEFCPLLENS